MPPDPQIRRPAIRFAPPHINLFPYATSSSIKQSEAYAIVSRIPTARR